MEVLSPNNAAAVLKRATQRLAGFENPALDAELLLAHVLDCSRSRLLSFPEQSLTEAQHAQFRQLIEHRALGTPVAYLIGRREFWSLDLQVTPDVLIPRPETELLVELALQKIPHRTDWRIADLGSGSGAIALAIAKERPACRLIATDISPAALEIARGNAERLAIHNVEFRLGDWCSALHGECFDMIVSNPPYVASGDPHLDDLGYEPQLALVAGENGSQYLYAIAAQAREYFRVSGGWLMLEHGYDQGAELLQRLAELGYARAEDHADLAEIPRIAVARWNMPDE